MKRRNVAVWTSIMAAALAVGVFGSVTVKAEEGVKLVFSQDLDTGEKANQVMNDILAEYTEKTGTEIQFESLPSTDYRTWLMTQFAAEQGPDVYTGIIYDMTQDYQSGYLCNFKDIYENESVYDAGKAWKDTLPDYIRERMYITADDVPGYPTATSVVRIFYNKSMLEQAGAEVPTTWAEFMDVCQKLKDNGMTAFAFPNATINDLSWLWFNNSVCSQMDYTIVDELDVSGNGYVELAEICKGMDEGIIDFSNEKLKASFELMKEFSQYWTSDYNGLDHATAVDMFARGEVAMVQAMSIKLESIETIVGDSFEYGVMPIPVITEDTAEGTLGKSVILGGQPDIIFGINSALMEDETRYNAALDFVQYMSSPEIQVRLAEELCRIPLANTVELPEKLEGFKITEEPLRMAWFTGINEKLRNYFQRAGQEYLSDSISVDEFAQTMNDSYKEVLDEIKAENNWNADNNYGMEQ